MGVRRDSWKGRRIGICIGGKGEGNPGRLARGENPEVSGLSDIQEHVAMTLSHRWFQHRKDADKPVFVEVVVRNSVGFNVELRGVEVVEYDRG